MTDEKTPSVFDKPRYVGIIPSQTYARFSRFGDEDLVDIDSEECIYNEDYVIAVFEPMIEGNQFTIEDVMDITGAIAVHEEWTHAIVTRDDVLDELSRTYPWAGGGMMFFGDMLTAYEKMYFLLKHLNQVDKTKEGPWLVEDISYNLSKGDEYKPLLDKVDLLFGNTIASIKYNNKEEVLYWPPYIEDEGFFLAVIDDELEDEEEIETPKTKYPLTNYNDYDYDDDDYWDYWERYRNYSDRDDYYKYM